MEYDQQIAYQPQNRWITAIYQHFLSSTQLSGRDEATMARVQLRDLMESATCDIWGSLISSLCSGGVL
jgi:hypothetical protein